MIGNTVNKKGKYHHILASEGKIPPNPNVKKNVFLLVLQR